MGATVHEMVPVPPYDREMRSRVSGMFSTFYRSLANNSHPELRKDLGSGDASHPSVQYRVMIISPAVHTQYCHPYRRTIRTGTLCLQRYCLNFIGCDGLMPSDITDTGISNTSGTTPVPVLSPERYVLPQDDFTSKDDSLIYFTSGSVVIGNDLYVIDWNHYRILKFEQPGEYFDDTTAGRNLHAVVERPVSSASDRMMWSHSAHPIPGGVCLSTGPSSSPKR